MITGRCGSLALNRRTCSCSCFFPSCLCIRFYIQKDDGVKSGLTFRFVSFCSMRFLSQLSPFHFSVRMRTSFVGVKFVSRFQITVAFPHPVPVSVRFVCFRSQLLPFHTSSLFPLSHRTPFRGFYSLAVPCCNVIRSQNRFYLHGNSIASLQTSIPILIDELKKSDIE